MADVNIEFKCPNTICKRPYRLTLHAPGTEKATSEGGTLIFRCSNCNCRAMIQVIFVGEQCPQVKWIEEPAT